MENDLRPEIIPSALLKKQDASEMLALLHLYFDGIEPENFRRDLAAKDWVLLLRDTRRRIMGFTTAQFLNVAGPQGPVRAVFSGDTVKHMDYFGTDHFAPLWISFMLDQRKRSPHPLYWFLICSGFRTYKFLPAFFKAYYPRPEEAGGGAEAARAKALLDAVGKAKFGDEYQAATGLVRFANSRERLKAGVAPANEETLRNAHARFFQEKNPRHAEGVELACLAEIHPDNFRPLGLRLARACEERAPGTEDLPAPRPASGTASL